MSVPTSDAPVPSTTASPVPSEEVRQARWGEVLKNVDTADERIKTLSERLVQDHKNALEGMKSYNSHPELEAAIRQKIQSFSALQNAGQQRAQWAMKKSGGVGKASHGTLRFLSNLGQLCQAYSGIADIIQTAGGPYTTAGYRALSCVFAIAMNRAASDEAISSRLESMCDFFPRIEMLAKIYQPDTIVARLVVEVHVGVVDFSDKVARYFTSRTRRFAAAFIPPSMQVDKTYEDMKQTLLKINDWTRVYLHRNVEETRAMMKGVKDSVEILHEMEVSTMVKVNRAEHELELIQSKVETLRLEQERLAYEIGELQAQGDKDRLESFRLALQLPASPSEHTNLKFCHDKIRGIFNKPAGPYNRGARPSPLTRERLEAAKCYQRWREDSTKKILLLGGRTHRPSSLSKFGYSWITPAVLDWAFRLREKASTSEGRARNGTANGVEGLEDTETVGFFTCHPGQWLEDHSTFVDLVASILYQVVEKHPSVLRDDKLRNFAGEGGSLVDRWRKEWRQAEMEERSPQTVTDFVGLALDLAATDRTICIVIDRIDSCKQVQLGEAKMVLEALEAIAVRASNVKFLITYDWEPAHYEKFEAFMSASKITAGNAQVDQSSYSK